MIPSTDMCVYRKPFSIMNKIGFDIFNYIKIFGLLKGKIIQILKGELISEKLSLLKDSV